MHQSLIAVRLEGIQEKPPSITDTERRCLQPTARESQVLQLICDGGTSKEIAAQLGICFKTATSHRTKLMQKAGVHSSIALFLGLSKMDLHRLSRKGVRSARWFIDGRSLNVIGSVEAMVYGTNASDNYPQ